MSVERVARNLLGAATLCGLLVSAGCSGVLSSNNSSGPSGGTPIASVKGSFDWGESLLAGGTIGVDMFPAKFTFDATATPSCANDYVAFNTSLVGVSPTGKAMQGGNMFAATGMPVGTFTISDGAASLVLTAAADNTGNDFLVVDNAAAGPGSTTNAASLAARIVALGGPLGVTATSAGPAVSLAALSFGIEGNNLVASTTLTNFTLGGAFFGGVGTGNIVAFNQLYATQGSATGFCAQDGPSVYWSYFTGTGTAVTSIVLSLDGSKVAFVENVAGVATLRILQWKAGEGAGTGYPVAPTMTLPAATSWAAGCPAGPSCLSSIAFSGAPSDTKSSPFYVYGNNADVLYVGDNNGNVHKFIGVFNGTPAEVTTGGWPIAVNAGAILTSPIFDSVSGNIFVGDSTGRLSFIQEVGSVVGGATPCSPLPCLNTVNLPVGTAGAIVDAPIVDGTNGTVFAVNGTDTTNSGTILQASTALTGAVSFSLGGGLSVGSPIYSGAFDNTYFTSPPGAIAGHMYVCGKQPGVNDRPAIYQLNFTAAGVLNGATPLGGLASADGEACSPVTEFFNPNGAGPGVARDWIFFSIGNSANSVLPIPAGACQSGGASGAGCVISVDVTNPLSVWPPASVTNTAPVPANPAGSTSGIIVDNQADTSIGVFPQASSLYFTLGANSTGAGPGVPSCDTTNGVGCAIKLTQAGLN
jgi:hypothetical protein